MILEICATIITILLIPFLWILSKPLPPYAGKSGNEYLPPGKKTNNPIDGGD